MKMLDYLFAPVALAGLVATGWWGLYQSPQRPANLAAQLEQNANSTLAANGYDWAHVRMKGQRAVLTGAAPSDDAAMAAAELVLRSAGPGGVVAGGITVVEVSVEPGIPVSPFVWRAELTPDGSYILSGHVPSRRIAAQIEAEATELAGGRAPESHMEVAAGWPGGNWQGVARFGLEALSQTESGEVRLADKTLLVSAVETDPDERARLSAQVANVTAPFQGEPLIRGKALWMAAHETDGLVLSGTVHSEAEHRELLGIVQANYSGEIVDRMEVAPGPPDDWLDQVRAGLPHFARFSSGAFEVHAPSGDVGIIVEGKAPGSTMHYLKQDMAAPAGPYPVRVLADPVNVDVPEIAGVDFSADPAGACEQAFSAVMAAHSISFDADAATISRASGPTLDKLMTVSRRCAPDLVFELGGHTDSVGDPAANTALSEARATAVMEYMISAGFDPHRLSAVGYGPDQPVQSNDTPEGRAANRRIEFKVRTRSD